ncbi:hypothetical protein NDU88_001913 [Pleurodeles waltl]|uniref:Uncharacterized protein n=1 Tax=Pleurodeles waltl TaxID=8319 RepID=A0AAV7RC94_PLEWA|nr:hypothetical protein NDU88_001913 [Pleurodeles waltl]
MARCGEGSGSWIGGVAGFPPRISYLLWARAGPRASRLDGARDGLHRAPPSADFFHPFLELMAGLRAPLDSDRGAYICCLPFGWLPFPTSSGWRWMGAILEAWRRGAARTSGVDDTDGRKRGRSQAQISAQGTSGANGRVEIQQDGTMAVVVPEMTDESTDPSDVHMESFFVDT